MTRPTRALECVLVRAGRTRYREGLALQRRLHERVVGGGTPAIVLCEHESVYTVGRRASPDEFLDRARAEAEAEIVETDRGGKTTYHGPGQLVVYPILPLDRFGRDIVAYMRSLEQACLAALRAFGIRGETLSGQTGVWVGGAKVASIGVRVRKWVAMHGMAVNVCCSLDPFERIVPCGIRGCRMTTVSREAGREVTVEEFSGALLAGLSEHLALSLFEEVFR